MIHSQIFSNSAVEFQVIFVDSHPRMLLWYRYPNPDLRYEGEVGEINGVSIKARDFPDFGDYHLFLPGSDSNEDCRPTIINPSYIDIDFLQKLPDIFEGFSSREIVIKENCARISEDMYDICVFRRNRYVGMIGNHVCNIEKPFYSSYCNDYCYIYRAHAPCNRYNDLLDTVRDQVSPIT